MFLCQHKDLSLLLDKDTTSRRNFEFRQVMEQPRDRRFLYEKVWLPMVQVSPVPPTHPPIRSIDCLRVSISPVLTLYSTRALVCSHCTHTVLALFTFLHSHSTHCSTLTLCSHSVLLHRRSFRNQPSPLLSWSTDVMWAVSSLSCMSTCSHRTSGKARLTSVQSPDIKWTKGPPLETLTSLERTLPTHDQDVH
jgi:hypothetical protein